MSIKAEAYASHFTNHRREERLARALDECFDVTFGKEHGGLSFWIGDPKEVTRQRFGLTREVLIIYSSHAETDARCFTAIDNVLRNPDFRNRLDPILVALVHSGDPEKVVDLSRSQPDRIIVPFIESELLDSNRGNRFVRSRMAEVVSGVDSFGRSTPIRTDVGLFGRDEIVQSLVSRSLVGEDSGVFGLRKTGKTSVLYAVKRRIDERQAFALYLDCSGVGRHGQRWFQLLQTIVENAGQDLEHNVVDGQPYSEANAGQRFSLDCHRLFAAAELTNFVVILDEIEYITPSLSGHLGQHWDSDLVPFWQTIRATAQESFGKLSFIVAGVNPKSIETTHFGDIQNPILQLAVPHYVQPLDEKSLRDMVRTTGRYAGLNFAEPVYAYLGDRFGGHPYLVRLACSELWKTIDKTSPHERPKIEIEAFDKIGAEIQQRIAAPIRDILLSLVWWYPEQYQLLCQFADGDEEFVREYLAAFPDEAIQFARYGLIGSSASGKLVIGDIKSFLRENGARYRDAVSPFKRGDIPADRLPELPDLPSLAWLQERKNLMEILLRRLIIQVFGFSCGWNEQAMARMLFKALQEQADLKKSKRNFATEFVGLTPRHAVDKLLTEELCAVIVQKWELFQPFFGKGDESRMRFKMNMDTINISRRIPAHTHAVDSDFAADFRSSYDWLFSRVKKVPDILKDIPKELASIVL